MRLSQVVTDNRFYGGILALRSIFLEVNVTHVHNNETGSGLEIVLYKARVLGRGFFTANYSCT